MFLNAVTRRNFSDLTYPFKIQITKNAKYKTSMFWPNLIIYATSRRQNFTFFKKISQLYNDT